ncbi:MAG: class II aldolase/adducin family protein [Christensenellales bacterium]
MKRTEAKQIKSDLLEIGRRLYNRKLVAANDGNISARSSDSTVWITPSGVSKGYMDERTLLNVALDGKILYGKGRPSTEMAMHLAIYLENSKVNAVVHAHPPAATSLAIAGIEPDTTLYPEAYTLLGKVPVVPYAQPGTPQVGELVRKYCRDFSCVLLANHGAVTWGETLLQAWHRMEALEQFAVIFTITRYLLKKESPLKQDQLSALLA